MPIVINTNLNSITAQRSLETVNRQLTQSIQRLSSGLRINSARDDASGLVIATRLTSQIRGLNAAVRNLSDGISLVQTAEGGVSSITGNLHGYGRPDGKPTPPTNAIGDFAGGGMMLAFGMVSALLNDGCVRVTGLYSEKTGKTYDATVVLEDDGQYANFKLEFDQRKGGSR